MLNDRSPTTISGIKSRANTIRREKEIPQHQALDEAAQSAGCQNWRHALKSLSPNVQPPKHWCEFEVHWHDRESRTAGAEHLRIPISRPLSELVSQDRILRAAYIGGFAKEGDWLVDRSMRVPSKSSAGWQALRAARALQFIEATGLRPSTSRRRIHPKGSWDLRVPRYDHGTKWFDPIDLSYVLVDEPYGDCDDDPKRAEWAARHGRQIVRPPWDGMHNPDGGTVAYLIAEQGVDLAKVCRAVAGLQAKRATWVSTSRVFRAW